MRFAIVTLLLTLLSAAVAAPVLTQRVRLSPHETVSESIDGNRVMIVYGRPFTKHPKTGAPREIWGTLVPYGQAWRMGADEATLFITQKPLVFGGATIPAGVYSLYAQPESDGSAKLIVNKQVGQWGTTYDSKQDFARLDLVKSSLADQVDQFTITIENNPSGGGLIRMTWANTQYSTTFTIQK